MAMLNHERRVLSQKWDASIERCFQRFGGGGGSEGASSPVGTARRPANGPSTPRPAPSAGCEAETEEEMEVWYDALAALRALGIGETEAKRLMRSVPKPWPLSGGEMVAAVMKRRPNK